MEVVASSRKGGCKQSCQVFDHPAHDRAARSTLVYFTMSVEMQKHFGGISAIVSSGSKPLLFLPHDLHTMEDNNTITETNVKRLQGL